MSATAHDPFAAGPCVADLGETALLAQLRAWLDKVAPPTPYGMGDDTAVLPEKPRNLLTVDSLVWQRHWDAAVSPEAAGAKLLKRNLSDIAAMGGQPGEAVMAALLPARTSLPWLEKFTRGLAACAEVYNVPLVGGDLTEVPETLAFSMTLTGYAERPTTRLKSSIGDKIWITGSLGGSRASHHWKFQPRLAEGAWISTQSEVHAMIDVTDGLLKDLPTLLPEGAVARMDWEALPRRENSTWQAALTDGEDYELLFTIDGSVSADTFRARWAASPVAETPLTCLGEIIARPQKHPAGAPPFHPLRQEITEKTGYEHFAHA